MPNNVASTINNHLAARLRDATILASRLFCFVFKQRLKFDRTKSQGLQNRGWYGRGAVAPYPLPGGGWGGGAEMPFSDSEEWQFFKVFNKLLHDLFIQLFFFLISKQSVMASMNAPSPNSLPVLPKRIEKRCSNNKKNRKRQRRWYRGVKGERRGQERSINSQCPPTIWYWASSNLSSFLT